MDASLRAKATVLLNASIIDVRHETDLGDDFYAQRDEKSQAIKLKRQQFGTYHSDAQCNAEAEVLLFADAHSVVFVSQSTVLNHIQNNRGPQTSWTPETLYRFLTMFTAQSADPGIVYQSMLDSTVVEGFDVVNREALKRLVQPLIVQARMDFKQQAKEYETAIGNQEFHKIVADFDFVADEDKPIYSFHFTQYLTRALEQKRLALKSETESAAMTLEQERLRLESERKSNQLTQKERLKLEELEREKRHRQDKESRRRRRHASKPGMRKKHT